MKSRRPPYTPPAFSCGRVDDAKSTFNVHICTMLEQIVCAIISILLNGTVKGCEPVGITIVQICFCSNEKLKPSQLTVPGGLN